MSDCTNYDVTPDRLFLQRILPRTGLHSTAPSIKPYLFRRKLTPFGRTTFIERVSLLLQKPGRQNTIDSLPALSINDVTVIA